ncbi:NosD domain-containing protein [Candidatus Omnitrophota bacterium]
MSKTKLKQAGTSKIIAASIFMLVALFLYCLGCSAPVYAADNIFTDDVGIGTSDPDAKLHLTGGGMLQTISSNPTHVASITSTTYLEGAISVYVSGKYAYVAGYDTGDNDSLTIIDVFDPASPSVTGSISVSDSPYLNGAWDVYVSGQYAYVTARLADALTIIDVSDPSNPSYVASITGAGSPNYLNGPMSVYISGKYAYVTAVDDDALTIIDVSDPSNPSHVSSITGAGSPNYLNGAWDVYVSGQYAYVTAYGDNALTVIDVSDPSNPTHVDTISGSGSPNYLRAARGVYVSGRYAYVCGDDSDDALTIIDVSDPSDLSHVASITGAGSPNYLDGPKSVYVSGEYAYVAVGDDSALTVIDVSDPSSPAHIGTISGSGSPNYLWGAYAVYVSGKYAYVCARNDDAFTIIDLTGIDSPGANIGDISASSIEVTDNVDIGNNLYVRSGLNVGPRGILANGPLSVGEAGYFGDKVGIKAVDPDYDLTIDGNLGLLDGSSTYYTIFQGGDQTSFASDITYALPTDDGDSGEVLLTDGSGVLSWGSPSLPSGTASQTLRHNGSSWVANDLLFNTTTGIGIGDTSPGALLTVGDGDLFQVNSSGELALSVDTATTAISATQAGAGDILNLNNSSTEVFTVLASGNVGIGVDAPGAALEIGDATGTLADGADDLLIAGDLEIDDDLQIDGGAITTSVATAWDLANTQTSSLNIESGLLNLDTQNSRVGIGTTQPSEKLHLTGGAMLQTISSNPTYVGSVPITAAMALYVSGKYAYVTKEYALRVVDIADPSSPSVVGSWTTTSYQTYGIHVVGKYAYLAETNNNALAIIDVSNPSSPSFVSRYTHATYLHSAHDVYISGKYAYVVGWHDGGTDDYFTILDISDPSNPSYVGSYYNQTYLGNGGGIYVVGRYAYIANAGWSYNPFSIYDISDPASPTRVGTLTAAQPEWVPRDVYVSGRYAYLPCGGAQGDKLVIVDISDPTSPSLAGSYESVTYLDVARQVYVSGRYAYLTAAGSDTFTVVDVSDPSLPSYVGSYNNTTYFDGGGPVFVSGKYAYIASGGSADCMTILDISGIDSPGANIGDISASTIEVTENVDIGNNLYVRSGLNVGSGGILSNGPLSVSEGGYFGDKVGIKNIDPVYDLTLDGQLGILEGGGSPSDYTIFQGATQSTDITYTLPTDDGDSQEVLTTDGSGVLSWGSASGLPSGTSGQTLRYGASDWEASSLLFNDGTGIGIGDTSLQANMLLTVGAGDLFQVEDAGNIAAATGIASTGPITFSGLTTDGPVTVSSGVLGSEAQLATSRGGTGQNFGSTVQGSTLYFSGTGTMASLAPGTSGQYLKTQGASANPVWDNATNTAGPTLIVAASDSLDDTRADASYVCDGTDDDATIESAIAALSAGGGTVLLLEGTYSIGDTAGDGIDITKSNVSLVGSGRSTLLQRAGNNTDVDDGVITVGNGGTTVTGVTIADLSIDGVKATYNDRENLGIYFNQDVHQSRIQNTWVYDCFGDGIFLGGADGEENTNNLIQGNHIYDNAFSTWVAGITLYKSTYNVIVDNILWNNYSWANIYLGYDAHNNIVAGNNMERGGAYGSIFLVGADYNTVTGNSIEGSIGRGIRLGAAGVNAGSNNNIIAGNAIIDSAGEGIRIADNEYDQDNNLISSNILDGNNVGIYMDTYTSNNYAIGNEIIGSGSEVTDEGTDNTIQHRDEFEIDGTLKAAKFPTQAADTGITLTTADFGKTITVDSTSAQTVTLPSVDSTNIGGWFRVIKLNSGTVTVDAVDSDTIADSTAGGAIANSQTDQDYATITVELASTDEWIIAGAHGTWTTN